MQEFILANDEQRARIEPSLSTNYEVIGACSTTSAELRDHLHDRGLSRSFATRRNGKQPFSFSKRLYNLRWRIEAPSAC